MAGKITEYPSIDTGLFPSAGDLYDVSQVISVILIPPSIVYESRKVNWTQLIGAINDNVENIYTADGSLTGNRIVDLDGFNLDFTGANSTVTFSTFVNNINATSENRMLVGTSLFSQLSNSIDWSADNQAYAQGWIYSDNLSTSVAFGTNELLINASLIELNHAIKLDIHANNHASLYSNNGGFFVTEAAVALPNFVQITIAETLINHDTAINITSPSYTYSNGSTNQFQSSGSVIGFTNDNFSLNYIGLTPTEGQFTHDTKIVFDSPIYKFSSLTADRVPYINASNELVVSAITPTELGYLTGSSSNLQTQIDALLSGLSWKQAVRIATTIAGTLSSSFENGDTIDGVVLVTGDRILIKDQATATENGVYTVNGTGAPTRSIDMNAGSEFPSATMAVSEGTANADLQFVCSNNSPVTIGVTNIIFVQVGGTTYVGTTNRITVTGNVIDISASYIGQSSITTVGTITAGVWNGTDINATYLDGTKAQFDTAVTDVNGFIYDDSLSILPFVVPTGTVNAMVADLTPDFVLTNGRALRFASLGKNTITNPTINVDSTGVKTIVKAGNKPLIAGDFGSVGARCILVYNSTNDNFELLNPQAVGSARCFNNLTQNSTSSTSTVKLSSKLIPANTLSVGNSILFSALFSKTLVGTTAIARIGINTIDSITGVQQIGLFTILTASQNLMIFRNRHVRSATETIGLDTSLNAINDNNSPTVAITAMNIDWTVDQYIIGYGEVTIGTTTLACEALWCIGQRAE